MDHTPDDTGSDYPLVPDAVYAPTEYVWRISDFAQIQDFYASYERLQSPIFRSSPPTNLKYPDSDLTLDPPAWVLRLYPNGSRPQSGHLSVYLAAIPTRTELASLSWARRDVAFSIELYAAVSAPFPPGPILESSSETETLKYLGRYDSLTGFDPANTYKGEGNFLPLTALPKVQTAASSGGRIMAPLESGKYDLLVKCLIFRDTRPIEPNPGFDKPDPSLSPSVSYPKFAEVSFDAKWLDSEQYCDIVLTFPDEHQYLKAHRSVLASRSPYFAHLFATDDATVDPSDAGLPTIPIPSPHTHTTVRTIIHYLYTFALPQTAPTTFPLLGAIYDSAPTFFPPIHATTLRRYLVARILATSPPTASDWHTQLLFALRHKCRELELRVAEFVAARLDGVDDTDEMVVAVSAFLGDGADEAGGMGGVQGLLAWLSEVFRRVEPRNNDEGSKEGESSEPAAEVGIRRLVQRNGVA